MNDHCAHVAAYYWDLAYLPGKYWAKAKMYIVAAGGSWMDLKV